MKVSETVDAKLRRHSSGRNSGDKSDEETMSDVESKLNFLRTEVSKYRNKLNRMKKLKEEEEERQDILKVRKPITMMNRMPSTSQTRSTVAPKKKPSGAVDTNKHFQSIQKAKEIICQSSSDDEGSRKNYDGSGKWTKWEHLKVPDNMLTTGKTKSTGKTSLNRIIGQTYASENSKNLNDTENIPSDEDCQEAVGYLEDIIPPEYHANNRNDPKLKKKKVAKTLKVAEYKSKEILRRNRRYLEEINYNDGNDEQSVEEHFNIGDDKKNSRRKSRKRNTAGKNQDGEENFQQYAHVSTENINKQQTSGTRRKRRNTWQKDLEERSHEKYSNTTRAIPGKEHWEKRRKIHNSLEYSDEEGSVQHLQTKHKEFNQTNQGHEHNFSKRNLQKKDEYGEESDYWNIENAEEIVEEQYDGGKEKLQKKHKVRGKFIEIAVNRKQRTVLNTALTEMGEDTESEDDYYEEDLSEMDEDRESSFRVPLHRNKDKFQWKVESQKEGRKSRLRKEQMVNENDKQSKKHMMKMKLKEDIRNLPKLSEDNTNEGEMESEVEIMEDNSDDNGSNGMNSRQSNEVYVDKGELVIPDYLRAELDAENRPPITNWSREMDFKLLHYLKNMPQTNIARNKWQWLAAKLSEYGVTNEDVRIHVRSYSYIYQLLFKKSIFYPGFSVDSNTDQLFFCKAT